MPRTSDRVTQGDGATVDVDLLGVEPELPLTLQGNPSEGLVDLEQQIGVGDLEATGNEAGVSSDGVPGGRGRLGQQGGVRSGDRPSATDLCQPLEPSRLSLGTAHHHHGTGSIGDLAGRAGRDRAVFFEGRPEAGQLLDGDAGAYPLVLGQPDPGTGVSSASIRPAAIAEAARAWERAAYSSCSSRVIPRDRW